MVLDGITLRGSIVGTRLDLQEALAFAGEGAVKATVQTERLEDINGVSDRMRAGQIEGRLVLDFGNLTDGTPGIFSRIRSASMRKKQSQCSATAESPI